MVDQTTTSDGRRARGERTRSNILDAAVNLGSREGLEALTIGRLASSVEVSKSGLFAHFGSKEGLQLAAIEAARDVFIREVIVPGVHAEAGLPRLHATLDAWLSYFRRDVFPGGCFFQAASLEFDGRPGPVRDRVVEIMKQWLALLELLVQEAIPTANAGQLAFEINAIGLATNWQRQLLDDRKVTERAAEAFGNLIESAI